VYLSVCLLARIYPEPHARALPKFLCMLPMAVARYSSGSVTKSQGEGAILCVFFPIDNDRDAVWDGMIIVGLARRTTVYYVGMTIPEGGGEIFGENVDWCMQRRAHDRGLIASVGLSSLLSAAKGNYTPRAK